MIILFSSFINFIFPTFTARLFVSLWMGECGRKKKTRKSTVSKKTHADLCYLCIESKIETHTIASKTKLCFAARSQKKLKKRSIIDHATEKSGKKSRDKKKV